MLAVSFGLLAFLLAFAGDFIETHYVRAVQRFDSGEVRAREHAARLSVALWLVGVLGWVAVWKVGLWVLPWEAAGLYIGTKLAMRDNTEHGSRT